MKNLSLEDIAKIAKDIATDKIFSSCHMTEHELSNIGLVFMPIALGGLSDLSDADKEDIGMIYEYYDKAGPRGINGMPMFFSCRLVNKNDTKMIFEKVDKIKALIDSV